MRTTPPWTYAHAVRRWRLTRLRRATRVGAVLVAAVLASVAMTAPGRAQVTGTCDTRAVGCPTRMAVGLSTPQLPRTTDPLVSLEADLGRTADVALTFTAFRFWFDQSALGALAKDGRLPMITWEPWDPTVPDQDRYPLATIAAGDDDPYLVAQAARIKEIGRPVAIRFAHEMNASWYPWGYGADGNTPADYVAAYRHVHDVFAAQGVRNVTWVWSPALNEGPDAPDLAAFYPGDAYVDWVGLSVYFDQPTDTWANTVAPTVAALQPVAPGKPLYLTETGVLPGPDRAAMIHDLLGNLLRTPNAIGFTWFDIASREDWRIDDDPDALAAVREETSSPWYGPGLPGPAPLAAVDPAITGDAQPGETLTATDGTWRAATSTAGRWLTCTDGTTASCRPSGDTGPSLTLGAAGSWPPGSTVRYQVTATGPGGTTVATSAGLTVVGAPAAPAPPQVESHPGALRVVFPAPPAGATHWRLRVDGKAYQLVPVDAADYWLTGLTTGAPVSLSLAAVTLTADGRAVESAPTTGTVTPMAAPYAPWLSVTGTTATFHLPVAPTGADGWLLTVDGTGHLLGVDDRTPALELSTGVAHPWTLVAVTGTWTGREYGASSAAGAGSLTPVATPDPPTVTPGSGSLTFDLPALPAGATGWVLTVGPATYQLDATATTTTVTGLYPGYPATWTLRAVNDVSRSIMVTGKAAALP